jgi:hypothetical protein
MIDIHQLSGKRFAIILVDYSKSDDKPESYVVGGRAKIADGRLFVDRGTDHDFPVPEDTYERIKPVAPSVASILFDAEYQVTLTIGPASAKPSA